MTVNVQLRCHANDPVRHMIYYPPLHWINTPPTFIHPGRDGPPLLAWFLLLLYSPLDFHLFLLLFIMGRVCGIAIVIIVKHLMYVLTRCFNNVLYA